EAGKTTSDQGTAAYRNYFIYSPLFNGQQNRLSEVKLLFSRLVKQVEAYRVPHVNTLQNAPVRITPSSYLDKPLGKRCIPYYYDPLELYPVWSWEKTRRGEAQTNLSYHAGEYSSSDTVQDPLNYDIEAYDFFRVEGHIGKPCGSVLPTLVSQRDHFNLPFEVVALSTASISAFFNTEDHECHFRDLEAMYKVLQAEIKCKFGYFECMAARTPYQARTAAPAAPVASAAFTNVSAAAFRAAAGYRPGDFLRSRCGVVKGSVGEAYLSSLSRRGAFTRAAAFEISASTVSRAVADAGASLASGANFNMNALYAQLFYFIHSTESLFQVLDGDLDALRVEDFSERYESLMDAVGDLARVGETLESLDAGNDNYQALLARLRETGFYDLAVGVRSLLRLCLDDRLKALMEEYRRRVRELHLLTNLVQYAKTHPGMEHKAGVPKGGTFILVYHETPPRRLLAHRGMEDLTASPAAGRAAGRRNPAASVENSPGMRREGEAGNLGDIIKEAYVSDPVLLRNFEAALSRFMDTCRDMDTISRERIKDVLV
ncbi:MAG TPA: hypothetical protein VD772_09940, partial [Anseongella sp.]|nr:hypothetical protein [Anseongella sp.]